MIIKVEELTEENFASYGKILSIDGIEPAGGAPNSHSWYPQLSIIDSPTSVNLMEIVPREFTCQKFEAHDYTAENLLPLTGDIVITCIPGGELNSDLLKAFYVRQGTGVSLYAKTWHFVPFPLKGNVICAVVFKNNTSKEDIYFSELPDKVDVKL